MKLKIRKYLIRIFLGLILFYCGEFIFDWDYYKFYWMEITNGKVVRLIEISNYKTQPSIIVEYENKKVEIIQYYRIRYNFKLIKIGDKVCKAKNNHNFILIKNNGEKDLIKGDIGNDWLAFFLFQPNNQINIEKMKAKCSCLN